MKRKRAKLSGMIAGGQQSWLVVYTLYALYRDCWSVYLLS